MGKQNLETVSFLFFFFFFFVQIIIPCLMKYVIICAIWHHLYNLKKKKNTYEGMLLLVKLQTEALLRGCFPRF